MKKDQESNEFSLPEGLIKRINEGSFILIIGLALFMFLALATYRSSDPGFFNTTIQGFKLNNAAGIVGAYFADTLCYFFGKISYAVPLVFIYLGYLLINKKEALTEIDEITWAIRITGLLLIIASSAGLLSFDIWDLNNLTTLNKYSNYGGLIGNSVAKITNSLFNRIGALLVICSFFMMGITWFTGLSWLELTEIIGKFCCITINNIKYFIKMKKIKIELPLNLTNFSSPKTEKKIDLPKINTIKNSHTKSAIEKKTNHFSNELKSIELCSRELPSISILEYGEPPKLLGGYKQEDLEILSRNLEQNLLDFGIQADVVAVHPGPVITRFELQLAAGVKANRLTSLSKDLARSLSVTSVRVVEVIPGKTVVGMELPNHTRQMVRIREIFASDTYQKSQSALTLALGVDISGNAMVVDLAKMPHLLVAGTTGSGKSVGINAMILSLLFKLTPDDVRLIMVDPKMLELSVYDGIPHLLTPVVTDMKEAAGALRWCVNEMERRYKLMANLGVRNIIGYNAKIKEAFEKNQPIKDPLWKMSQDLNETAPFLEKLPYIVVIIDELADMMMVVGKKVEQLIARIAQKARAAGIHLILATQRPSVDVLTGLIKSNIPTRISFQVSSKIDSRTILDQQGAESLLGHGDMLYMAPGTGTPIRAHGAFVDDKEVHKVAEDWRARGEPNYLEEITATHYDGDGNIGEQDSGATEEQDVLYDQAVEFVMQSRKASISSVQRRFKIGYNRAARLVEEMERVGIVGPLEGGFRDVLIPQRDNE